MVRHFLVAVYAFVLFNVRPVGVLATVGVCLAVAVWAEESEVCEFVVCSVSVDVVDLQVEVVVVVGVGVADSAFVCDEAFVNDSITDILSVACVFCEHSFVWFLVDSVEWLEWPVGVVGDSSAECFGLGVAVWAEVSEVF